MLCCRSGSMSALAAGEPASLGYTNILDGDGGLRAREAAKYELIRRYAEVGSVGNSVE